MLGLNHLLLRLWECETVNPAVGLRPVTWQTLLMITRDFFGGTLIGAVGRSTSQVNTSDHKSPFQS